MNEGSSIVPKGYIDILTELQESGASERRQIREPAVRESSGNGKAELDIGLIMDATGSMGPAFEAMQSNLQRIISEICDPENYSFVKNRFKSIRLKVLLVFIRDYCDGELVEEHRIFKLPEEIQNCCAYIGDRECTGGGGNDGEAYNEGMRVIEESHIDFNMIMLIGDEPFFEKQQLNYEGAPKGSKSYDEYSFSCPFHTIMLKPVNAGKMKKQYVKLAQKNHGLMFEIKNYENPEEFMEILRLTLFKTAFVNAGVAEEEVKNRLRKLIIRDGEKRISDENSLKLLK